MISDVDLADWLDSEYESPIPCEIIEEIAEICDMGTYRAQIGKFANIIGLLTLKFKPNVQTNEKNCGDCFATLFETCPEFHSMYKIL